MHMFCSSVYIHRHMYINMFSVYMHRHMRLTLTCKCTCGRTMFLLMPSYADVSVVLQHHPPYIILAKFAHHALASHLTKNRARGPDVSSVWGCRVCRPSPCSQWALWWHWIPFASILGVTPLGDTTRHEAVKIVAMRWSLWHEAVMWPRDHLCGEDHAVDLDKPKEINNVFQLAAWIPTCRRFLAHASSSVKVFNVDFVVCAVAIPLTEAPRRCIGHASTNFAFLLKVFAV